MVVLGGWSSLLVSPHLLPCPKIKLNKEVFFLLLLFFLSLLPFP